MQRAAFSFSLVLACLAAGQARAWTSPAPDVVLYCSAALEAPMRQVAAGFTAARDIEVHIFVSPPDGIVGLVRHRARADVVVADAPTLQVLAAGGQVRSGSVVALGRDPYVLIAHAAIAAPPADAVQPFLAAHATAVSDPTTAAGFDGHAVLHEVAPDLDAARITGLPDTPDIIDAVRADPDLVGLVLQTEAVAQKLGLHQVARLGVPPEPIAGGLVTLGQSANAADLLAYVAGPEGQATLHQAGLE